MAKLAVPARSGSRFACTECGHEAGRWFGRCPACGSWSSAAEVGPASGTQGAGVVALTGGGAAAHRATGIAELDRVLGGGLVPGVAVLLAGEPGIGKSTLVLQVLAAVADRGGRTLMVTGEESVDQVAARAERLGVPDGVLRVAATTSVPQVLALARAEAADLLVIDSVQTLSDPTTDSAPGSLVQVRESAAAVIRLAKESGTSVILIGHVNKEGGIAGPKVVEHLVDVVVILEGERHGALRLARALKNRFGACDETGVFEMTARGLDAVPDPSAMLLADRGEGIPGSVVFPSLEGSRPVLVEIQALVDATDVPQPRRVALGVDPRRLTLMLAVLGARAGVEVGRRDVFVSAAGGLRVTEPAADLAICLAVASALNDRPLPPTVVALGEVGLGGELRRVSAVERRLSEAARFGFRQAFAGRESLPPRDDVLLRSCRDVAAALVAANQVP